MLCFAGCRKLRSNRRANNFDMEVHLTPEKEAQL